MTVTMEKKSHHHRKSSWDSKVGPLIYACVSGKFEYNCRWGLKVDEVVFWGWSWRNATLGVHELFMARRVVGIKNNQKARFCWKRKLECEQDFRFGDK